MAGSSVRKQTRQITVQGGQTFSEATRDALGISNLSNSELEYAYRVSTTINTFAGGALGVGAVVGTAGFIADTFISTDTALPRDAVGQITGKSVPIKTAPGGPFVSGTIKVVSKVAAPVTLVAAGTTAVTALTNMVLEDEINERAAALGLDPGLRTDVKAARIVEIYEGANGTDNPDYVKRTPIPPPALSPRTGKAWLLRRP